MKALEPVDIGAVGVYAVIAVDDRVGTGKFAIIRDGLQEILNQDMLLMPFDRDFIVILLQITANIFIGKNVGNILFNVSGQGIQGLIDGGNSAVCKGEFLRTHGAEPEWICGEADE